MPAFDWDAELTPERRDALIDNLAEQAVKRRMQVPAILLLEMHKPLAFLGGQAVVLGSGFLAPLFGAENVQQYSKLLGSRENVELLIRRIEETIATPQKS